MKFRNYVIKRYCYEDADLEAFTRRELLKRKQNQVKEKLLISQAWRNLAEDKREEILEWERIKLAQRKERQRETRMAAAKILIEAREATRIAQRNAAERRKRLKEKMHKRYLESLEKTGSET